MKRAWLFFGSAVLAILLVAYAILTGNMPGMVQKGQAMAGSGGKVLSNPCGVHTNELPSPLYSAHGGPLAGLDADCGAVYNQLYLLDSLGVSNRQKATARHIRLEANNPSCNGQASDWPVLYCQPSRMGGQSDEFAVGQEIFKRLARLDNPNAAYESFIWTALAYAYFAAQAKGGGSPSCKAESIASVLEQRRVFKAEQAGGFRALAAKNIGACR